MKRYEERLNSKYEKKSGLIASSWTFIKDGLDDFRDGIPPRIDDSVIIKGNKGFIPSLLGSSSSSSNVQQKRGLPKQLSKNDIVYSRTVPGHEKRKNRVHQVEQNLLDHPLALYSHLEESVPPDLFEEIVDLLDPSLTLQDQEKDEPDEDTSSSPTQPSLNHYIDQKLSNLRKETCSGYNKAIINGNKKPKEIIDDDVGKEEKNRTNKKKANLPQLTKIEKVTKDFCDWVRDLGGETNNIEESTVNGLFASGYETKPTLSVPVHVVELTNIPPELRADDVSTVSKSNNSIVKHNEKSESYTPSWVKVKYGAWYLDPKTWKSRPYNEPLFDPQEINGKKLPEATGKNEELNKVLSSLHGAKAFRNFIDQKGTRNPKFLDGVPISMEDGATNFTGKKEAV